jgi:lipopolysaccharide export system protein LptC
LKPRELAIGLMLAVLFSLGWWIRELTTPEALPRPVAEASPDAFAETLRVHTYDSTGRLEQTLITPYMEHYESTDTSELNQPVLWRFFSDSPPWRMEAEKALANNKEARIFLPGKVVMDRNADRQNPAYHIVTRDLTLETNNARATTDQPVLIESGQNRITAIGMEGWWRAPIKLNLLNRVRGLYVFD